MPAHPANLHATALVLADRGILVAGPSGSGKTTLALALIRQISAAGRFARLVADDQVFVRALNGRLVVSSPDAIAGLAEVHGLGPRRLPHLRSAVIDLVVRLVPQAEAPRLPGLLNESIAGVELPRLDLPERGAEASALAVAAWLKAPPFAWGKRHAPGPKCVDLADSPSDLGLSTDLASTR
jgi:serine kinase of HPr protein (carbohydrate metabolism regulator)